MPEAPASQSAAAARAPARVGIQTSATRLAHAHERLRDALATPVDYSAFDLAHLDPSAVELARRFWRVRMEAEHRSVHVFVDLGRQLLEANAPLDAKTVALRMAEDELLHTEVCGKVLLALGAEPTIEQDVAFPPIAAHEGCTAEERALRNVVYATCLSEMIAVARLTESLERATDAGARSAIRAILADEVMHGQFGFLYLDAVSPDGAMRSDLAHYLMHAFAVLEQELAPPRMREAPEPPPDAISLGVIVPADAYQLFHAAIEEAVVPGLEARGIAAARAWRDRRISSSSRP